MLRLGFFIIDGFTPEKDAAGFSLSADVHSQCEPECTGSLYLPPYMRDAMCSIGTGSVVIGMLDDVTGIGVAAVGLDNADFDWLVRHDIKVRGDVSVTADMRVSGSVSAQGDVTAGSTSLKTHAHSVEVPDVPYIGLTGTPKV